MNDNNTTFCPCCGRAIGYAQANAESNRCTWPGVWLVGDDCVPEIVHLGLPIAQDELDRLLKLRESRGA
jgi:hypothetical protein